MHSGNCSRYSHQDSKDDGFSQGAQKILDDIDYDMDVENYKAMWYDLDDDNEDDDYREDLEIIVV